LDPRSYRGLIQTTQHRLELVAHKKELFLTVHGPAEACPIQDPFRRCKVDILEAARPVVDNEGPHRIHGPAVFLIVRAAPAVFSEIPHISYTCEVTEREQDVKKPGHARLVQ
jgi:hypothetical protein